MSTFAIYAFLAFAIIGFVFFVWNKILDKKQGKIDLSAATETISDVSEFGEEDEIPKRMFRISDLSITRIF